MDNGLTLVILEWIRWHTSRKMYSTVLQKGKGKVLFDQTPQIAKESSP